MCHIPHGPHGRRCSSWGLSYWEASNAQEGHTEALEESTPVSSSGLWAGALCWKLGFIYGEYHEPGAEMLTLLPAHICQALPRTSPTTKAVLQPASSRAMARHGWSQPWGAALPWALTRLLWCCPSPPAQHHPHGRQAPGKCGTGPWGHSLTSCPHCCSVRVPSLPTHLLPVLATEQHRSPGNTWPSVGGRGQSGQGPWLPTLAPCFQHHRCSHSERRTEQSLRLPTGCCSCDVLHQGCVGPVLTS